MNVYRALRLSGTLEPILQWVPQGPTVVGGDFNEVSKHWQPQATCQYGNSDQIMEWALALDMQLVTQAGVPTHQDGNVLDLVCSNTFAEALVSSRNNCTSDHMKIEGSVQAASRLDLTRVSQDLQVCNQDLLKFFQYVKAWVKPGPIRNVKEIELKVSNLLEALKDVRRAVGQKPVRIAGRSAPWWNEECKLKHPEFRESRKDPEQAAHARKRFRATVKAAKRDHWRKQVENATMDTNVFRIMQWAKPKSRQEPPPLKVSEDKWILSVYHGY